MWSGPPPPPERAAGAPTGEGLATAPISAPPPLDAPYDPGGTPGSGSGAGSNGRGLTIVLAVVAGLLAGLIGGAGSYLALGRNSESVSVAQIPQSSGEAPPVQDGSVAAIAQAALPSVVSLEVTGGGEAGSGSGFVLRADGYILTNNHVIANAVNSGSIEVTFDDGSSASGEIVGRSKSYDLGVVKVNRNDLPTASLGNSNAVRVGDPVVAIGAPLGLTETVTTGIVSALDRPVTAGGQGDQSFISAIQTDAAINPGNSGGPLLDREGRVIGINSAIASIAQGLGGQSGSIGLGFAIPVNVAKRISEEIIATGSAANPIIGVTLDTQFSGTGAKIESVNADGPASGSGLRAGEIITSVNGEAVGSATELIVAIRSNAPGDTITLGVEGHGDVTVELGSAKDG